MTTEHAAILDSIKADFCEIITHKERGTTLEVSTNLVTLNQAFVSVFISRQDERFVISDGGWLHIGDYDVKVTRSKTLAYLVDRFGIKLTRSPVGRIYYYKTAPNLSIVSSMVHDVAHFVQAVVNGQVLKQK